MFLSGRLRGGGRAHQSGRGFNADLFAILFGSIVTVTPARRLGGGGADGAVVGTTVALFYRQLLAITLSEELARTSGVPVAALNLT